MNLVAFDTSTEYLSVAVIKNGRVAARYHKKAGRNHSRLLVPVVSNLVKRAGLKISGIDALAVGVGPGSFTGLRIGAAVAKGLAYSLGARIAAVPTFDAIARNFTNHKGVVCVVLDARKNKVYGCFYRSNGDRVKRISKYSLVPAADLLKKAGGYDRVIFAGDGAGLLGKEQAKKPWHPRAEVIAALGLELISDKKTVRPEDLEPMYLYSKECDITGR